MTEEAKARLRIIKDTNDGFKIAEEDLRLRGPGDITGLRQSGFAESRLADITEGPDGRNRILLMKIFLSV